jgi:hypothetical protein
MAIAAQEQREAARRENADMQETIRQLLWGFTLYMRNQSTLPRGAPFDAVVQDIQQVCFDEELSPSYHNTIE